MSISSRIWEMNNHLIADYDVLTLAGADLTNVDKNILNLKPTWKERLLYFMNNGTQEVWNNWTKVSGTGTTLSLNNTEEAPMSLIYKGNTSQSGTPTPDNPVPIQVVSGENSIEVVGKNLFNKDTTNVLNAYINGSSVITSSTSDRSYWLPIQKNTNYTIKMTQLALSTSQYIDDFQCGLFATTPVLSLTGNRVFSRTRPSATQDYTFTETFNSGNYDYLVIKVGNSTRTNITESLKTLQLEVGTTATTYEEYKSASYPITLPEGMFLGWIPNTTYQDKIDKSTGRNLVNYLDIPNAPSWSLYPTDTKYIELTLKPNTQYTMSSNVPLGSSTLIYFKGSSTATNGVYDNHPITQTTDNNGKIFFAVFDSRQYYSDVISGKYYIMLNEGSTALPYEPYGTGWYLKKEIGKKENLVSDFVSVYTSYTNLDYIRFLKPSDSATKGNANNIPALLTRGKYAINYNFNNADYINYFSPNGEYNNFWLGVTKGTTTEQAQTILTNSTLYYPLATPTYETITDTTLLSQLEALKKSYENVTNISQVNNDLPFELDVTALSNQ